MVQLGRLKQNQDAERRKLVELRDVLRTFMSSYKDVSVNVEWRFFYRCMFSFSYMPSLPAHMSGYTDCFPDLSLLGDTESG